MHLDPNQGDYVARSWARTTLGYHFEDENGWVGDLTSLPLGHGLRRNHAVFGQEVLTWTRVTVIAGALMIFSTGQSSASRRSARARS